MNETEMNKTETYASKNMQGKGNETRKKRNKDEEEKI